MTDVIIRDGDDLGELAINLEANPVKLKTSWAEGFVAGPAAAETERRIADYVISTEVFLHLLQRHNDLWIQPEMPEVPRDAKIRAVNYSFNRDAFMVRLESASFAAVPVGDLVPIKGELQLRFRTEETSAAREVFPAHEAGTLLSEELSRIDVIFSLLAFMGRDLRPGETSADRHAACQRLTAAVPRRNGRRDDKPDLYNALAEAMKEAR